MLEVPKNFNLLKEWQSRNGRTYGPGLSNGAYLRDPSPSRTRGAFNPNNGNNGKTPMQFREYGGYDPLRSNYYDRSYENYNPYDRDSRLLMSGIHGGGTLVQPFGPNLVLNRPEVNPQSRPKVNRRRPKEVPEIRLKLAATKAECRCDP